MYMKKQFLALTLAALLLVVAMGARAAVPQGYMPEVRAGGALVLVPVLLFGTGCPDGATPTGPGVDQEVTDVESTLDAIESDLAGDG